MLQLQPNATLQDGKYIIKKVLGHGGFGITYLAEHDLLGTKVAIKEFFMKDFCNRDETTSHVSVVTESGREQVARFREKFLKEARNIARLRHPNIVRISDVFEENGTAYYVMDYCEGGSLSELLKLHPNGIGEPLALKYIHQVASALEQVHAMKMNHLDIKPANILLDAQGNAVLIDFGLAKQYDVTTGNQTSTTPVGISHGYAPIEQYKQGGVSEFSPATDIYSLGATLYKLITGQTPPEAQVLLEEELPAFTAAPNVATAIRKAMQVRRADRPQCIKELMNLLGETYASNSHSSSSADRSDKQSSSYKQAADDESTIVASVNNNSTVQCEKNVYILVNKTKGALALDEIIPNSKDNFMKIGDSEADCSGLVLLTNDNALAYMRNSPLKTIYHVWLDKDVIESDLHRIAKGFELEDGFIYAEAIAYADENIKNQIGIEVHSCKKNIIRRIFSHLGYQVTNLERVYLAGLNKRNLRLGQSRNLSEQEVLLLKDEEAKMEREAKEAEELNRLVEEVERQNREDAERRKFEDEQRSVYKEVQKSASEDEAKKKSKNKAIFSVIGIVAVIAIFFALIPTKSYFEKGLECEEKGQYTEAFNYFYKGAQDGDPSSMAELGRCYLHGEGVSPDTIKAFANFEKAAKEGNLFGIHNLGICYLWGWGTPFYPINALDCFEKAAESDFFPSIYTLAWYYAGGRHENAANFAKAEEYLNRALQISPEEVDKKLVDFIEYKLECEKLKEKSAELFDQAVISESKEVDLGLSVIWSGYNVGASSSTQYGDLFAFGDPTGKKTIKDIEILEPMSGSNDIAHVMWGGSWRLPTKAECEELIDKCAFQGINYKGVNGMEIVGPNGNAIFLPAAGRAYNYGRSLAQETGNYFTCDVEEYYDSFLSGVALHFDFESDPEGKTLDFEHTGWSCSVRPVRGR